MFYIRTIEAVPVGVVRGVLDDERFDERGVKIYNVTSANMTKEAAAVDFCIAQLGKPYVLKLSGSCSYSSSSPNWYCSELVWAAYYNQGINLFGTMIPLNIYLPSSLTYSDKLIQKTISLR